VAPGEHNAVHVLPVTNDLYCLSAWVGACGRDEGRGEKKGGGIGEVQSTERDSPSMGKVEEGGVDMDAGCR